MTEVPAGSFSAWLADTLRTRQGADADVPCGTCTACCRSSMFVHVGPDDVAARRRIPKALLFPAPGRPKGHFVLGFDEHGRCPMLVDEGCSIYDDRPRTCRAFDCRVLAAAGRTGDKPDIAARVRAWRFGLDTPDDLAAQAAVTAAVAYLEADPDVFDGARPRDDGDLAAAAIAVHQLFIGCEAPEPAVVRSALKR